MPMDCLRSDLTLSVLRKDRIIDKKKDMILNIAITILLLLILALVWTVQDTGAKVIVFTSLFFPFGFLIFILVSYIYEKKKGCKTTLRSILEGRGIYQTNKPVEHRKASRVE